VLHAAVTDQPSILEPANDNQPPKDLPLTGTE